jgi:N-acetyl-gamma-glutamyl-phosphate reductase
MIKVGIYGATGYTGFELIKLLHRHSQALIVFATSRNDAGKRLCDVFPTTLDIPLIRTEDAAPAMADVVFCCLPHGASAPLVKQVLDAGARVIDLSADFRLHDMQEYDFWYGKGKPHPTPELLDEAVYGLPELYREDIRQARLVANPGCYATSIILGLYPLVNANLLAEQTVIVDSKSGVSGAGRSLSIKTHFSEANENFSAYNIGRSHRHISEIEQETGVNIVFSPHLLPVTRGILSTMYASVLPPGTDFALLHKAYELFVDEPFVKVLPNGKLPELRHVTGTNFCIIGFQPEVTSGRTIIVSVIDNLLKGASGQAVQNMNLMFGLDEKMGLV